MRPRSGKTSAAPGRSTAPAAAWGGLFLVVAAIASGAPIVAVRIRLHQGAAVSKALKAIATPTTTRSGARGKAPAPVVHPLPDWVNVLGAIVLIGVVVVLVGYGAWRVWQARPLAVEDESLLAAQAVGPDPLATRAAVARSLRRLLEGPLPEGDPRADVLARWGGLEAAVGQLGSARAATETAAELTTRVLGELAVDPVALASLYLHYRSARFSPAPVLPADAEECTRLLKVVLGSLEVRPIMAATSP